MASGTSSTSQIGSELFKNFLDIKGVGRTFWAVLVRPKSVVDSFYENRKEFVSPVRFAVTILAPYIILINLTSFSDDYMVMMFGPEIEESVNTRAFFSRFISIFFEYQPLLLAVVYAPILAFWLRALYREGDLRFAYYYGLSLYVVVSVTVVNITYLLLSLAMGWDNLITYAFFAELMLVALVINTCVHSFSGSLRARVLTAIGALVAYSISIMFLGGAIGIVLGLIMVLFVWS